MIANNTASEKDAAFPRHEPHIEEVAGGGEQQVTTNVPTQVIIKASQKFNLTIFGLSAHTSEEVASIRPVAERLC